MSLTQLELFSIDPGIRHVLLNASEYQFLISELSTHRKEQLLYRHRETESYFNVFKLTQSLEFVLMMSDQCLIDYTKKVAILYRSDLNGVKRTEREYPEFFWNFIDRCEKQLIDSIKLVNQGKLTDFHKLYESLLLKLVLVKAYLGRKSEIIPKGLHYPEKCPMSKALKKMHSV